MLVGTTAISACSPATGAEASATRTTFGAPVSVGRGTARAYVTTSDGRAVEVGVALTEGALDGLPADHAPGGVAEGGHTMFEHPLTLPTNPSPFRHVVLNWNPGGHEPPGIYDTPHFDFHFYNIESAERLAIDPADPAFQRKAEHTPDAQWIPERYILPAPVGFARMGVHWLDSTAAELRGQGFTQTFIYGSWDGKIIFAEPMITRAFLLTKPQVTTPLPAPPRGRGDGYYPGAYSVRWDANTKEYRIALVELGPRT
jgi:hypothetical protein